MRYEVRVAVEDEARIAQTEEEEMREHTQTNLKHKLKTKRGSQTDFRNTDFHV